MTKKDYDNITRAINHAYQYCENLEQFKGVELAKRQLLVQLDGNYPKFDRIKFLNACRVYAERTREKLAD